MEKDEGDSNGELFSPYEEAFMEMGKAFGLNLTCQRFPIKDLSVPSPQDMNRILNEIDSSLSRDRPSNRGQVFDLDIGDFYQTDLG